MLQKSQMGKQGLCPQLEPVDLLSNADGLCQLSGPSLQAPEKNCSLRDSCCALVHNAIE